MASCCRQPVVLCTICIARCDAAAAAKYLHDELATTLPAGWCHRDCPQVPPLRYEWVWALKRDFPHLDFSLNGGVLTLEETAAALRIVNGEQPEAAASGDGEQGGAEAAAAAAAEASGEGVAAAAAAAVGIPAGSSAGVAGRQGIWGVMVGRAAYNMPWDMLGASSVACVPWAAVPAVALASCSTRLPLSSCCIDPVTS